MSENLFYKFMSLVFPDSSESGNVNIVSPIDLLQIDPNIRAVVYWLRKNGFETKKSSGIPNSNIEIHVSPDSLISETRRLRDLLFLEHEINIHSQESKTRGLPRIDAFFKVKNDIGKIFLHNVADCNLKIK